MRVFVCVCRCFDCSPHTLQLHADALTALASEVAVLQVTSAALDADEGELVVCVEMWFNGWGPGANMHTHTQQLPLYLAPMLSAVNYALMHQLCCCHTPAAATQTSCGAASCPSVSPLLL